jgi:polyisoprenoid-binding protein YceI
MAVCYKLDPTLGKFTVQAFASGLLSALGHSPTFAVRDFSGSMQFDRDEIRSMILELTIRADSLELLDRVRESDRREIIDRTRREVLATSSYPVIAYRSDEVAEEPIAPGRFRVRIVGHLSLHGLTRPYRVDCELRIYGDGIRLFGECLLLPSEYGIRPVTALAGAIRLEDRLRISFDIAGLKEAS